ncbi:MAG TPA: FlgD immunoglobulin-like domain containing protein, partial [bacterium]|nr:FlgD immunoglobulin-like domain containing protein [bacterium]
TYPVTVPTGVGAVLDAELEPAAVYVDFSNPAGWTEDNDPEVVGTWTFADPYPTYLHGILFQTGDDHTPGADAVCAVTGNFTDGVDDADVDQGATRLLSPVYDLSAMTAPRVLYYRWYATEKPLDDWEVEVSQDGGSSWILLESTNRDERFWKAVDLDLSSVLTTFDQVRFRFVAQDHPPEQIVEGAVDDFTLYDGALSGTPVPGPAPTGPALSLRPAAPNPFATSTRIRFATPESGRAELRVVDVRGARVATLLDRNVAPGSHEIVWDGRTEGGGTAAAGVYFVELRHGGERRSAKLLRSR